MDSNSLLVVATTLGTLVAVGALAGTALMAGAYVSERNGRQSAERRADDAERANYALTRENDALRADNNHLAFIRGNKLLSRAHQDLGFAAGQSLAHVRALRAEIEQELDVVDKLLSTATGK